MEEKLCPDHEDDIVSVCFFEGCDHHLLCKECLKSHPDSHNSHTKSVISVIKKDDWIKLNEEQRDSQIAQLKSIYRKKDSLFSEDEQKLGDMIAVIIECLEKKLTQWARELDGLLDLKAKSNTKETFAKIGEMVNSLENINFREGDVYDKVSKAKLFNETIMPKSLQLCKQSQDIFAEDRIVLDQSKLDAWKQEPLEPVKKIHLSDFFILPNSNHETTSKQLDQETLTQENQDIQQLLQKNYEYKQGIENLAVTNEKLLDQIFKLKSALDSLVAVKLELQTELEPLKAMLKKFPKAGLLSEDSQIIEHKDIENIRAWISKPSKPEGLRHCKLNLLYRATRDGFTSDAFYQKTNQRTPTISFIKSKGYGRVFGGYTTLPWRLYSGYSRDEEAFLFSLTHGEKYPILKPSYAMHGRKDYILSFGADYDIQIAEGCDKQQNRTFTVFPYYYSCSKFKSPNDEGAQGYLAGSSYFFVEEIEVYQVIWS